MDAVRPTHPEPPMGSQLCNNISHGFTMLFIKIIENIFAHNENNNTKNMCRRLQVKYCYILYLFHILVHSSMYRCSYIYRWSQQLHKLLCRDMDFLTNIYDALQMNRAIMEKICNKAESHAMLASISFLSIKHL